MTDAQPANTSHSTAPAAAVADDDPLAHLHKMSTTAGLGTTEYVAINPMAVATICLGAASGLALLDAMLLALPVVTIVVAIIALRQIHHSGGTQTGRGLWWGGLLLALLFAGIVGGRAVAAQVRTRADQAAIANLVGEFSNDVTSGNYEAAYAKMTPKFQNRVKPQQFTDLWTNIQRGRYGGKLKSLSSNQRLAFETLASGDHVAAGMMVS